MFFVIFLLLKFIFSQCISLDGENFTNLEMLVWKKTRMTILGKIVVTQGKNPGKKFLLCSNSIENIDPSKLCKHLGYDKNFGFYHKGKIFERELYPCLTRLNYNPSDEVLYIKCFDKNHGCKLNFKTDLSIFLMQKIEYFHLLYLF